MEEARVKLRAIGMLTIFVLFFYPFLSFQLLIRISPVTQEGTSPDDFISPYIDP